MNNVSKNVKNNDGTVDTFVISSNDDKSIDLTKSYVLANNTKKKKMSNMEKKFKNSLLGTEVGVKSAGFTNIAVLGAVIAVCALAILFFMWRF